MPYQGPQRPYSAKINFGLVFFPGNSGVSDLRKQFGFFRGFLKSYSKILKAARRAAKNLGVFGIFLDSGVFSRVFSGVPKSEKKVWSVPSLRNL